MISFKNKNVLITGASGGIGNELVKKFVSLGANVLGTGTKAEKLDLIKSIDRKTILALREEIFKKVNVHALLSILLG